MFATKQPPQPYLLALTAVEPLLPPPELSTKADWNYRACLDYSAAWIYQDHEFISDDVFADIDVFSIMLFPGVQCSSAGMVTCRALPVPLGPYLRAATRDVPLPKDTGQQSTPSASSKTHSLTTQAHWTTASLVEDATGPIDDSTQAGTQQGLGTQQVDQEQTGSDSDAEYAAVFGELESHRAAWEEEQESEQDWFKISLLGGKWSIHRAGRAIYGFRADVRAKSKASQFCEQFGCSKSATFDNEVYGEVLGSALARTWVARMSSLARAWCEQGCPETMASNSFPSFSVPQELETTFSGVTGKAAKRLAGILSISP